MSSRCSRRRTKCLVTCLSAVMVAAILLSGPCLGSNNATSPSGPLKSSWAAVTSEYPIAPTASPSDSNETAVAIVEAAAASSSAIGKPSKFDEHVEEWQYVDEPLKNVTGPAVAAVTAVVIAAPVPAGNATAPVCKICLMAKNKPRRNKRNHDSRLFKLAAKSSRRRELYAELMAAAAAKQSFRCKRFRRSAAARSADDSDPDAARSAETPSDARKRVYRYKRFRRSIDDRAVVEPQTSERPQFYRRKRFGRSAMQSPYPNGPYHYSGYRYQQQQQPYPSALAADLQLQQNRRRRYRYAAADPYHYRRNTAWDRSVEFRRRYLRFPPTHDAPPPSYANLVAGNGHNAIGPWSPSAAVVPGGLPPPLQPPQQLQQQQPFTYLPQYPVQQQSQPLPPQPPQPMGPRSPRLVFRDPVDQGTLQAPYGGGPNGLQDLLVPQPDDIKGCGVSVAKQQGAQRRIVGGDEAGFGSFPWQAYIRIGSSRCGGSLVNRFHVVTAGHCVARASARQVQVTLGDYVINSAVEPLPAYTFGVRKISVHPFFKFTPQADRFDVAVLRLDRPVQYMPHIAPICLPDKGEDFLGNFGWAAGWGALQAGSRMRPKTLQAVDVPIIDNRQCERWHKSNGINVIIYDEMMCAGYREGSKDSCQGDSGGPLMLEKTGRWYLIGIVSAGYSCAQRGQPGIYHRVALTVDWISYIINSSQ